MLEVIKDKIRVYMNDIADHMAGGDVKTMKNISALSAKLRLWP